MELYVLFVPFKRARNGKQGHGIKNGKHGKGTSKQLSSLKGILYYLKIQMYKKLIVSIVAIAISLNCVVNRPVNVVEYKVQRNLSIVVYYGLRLVCCQLFTGRLLLYFLRTAFRYTDFLFLVAI